MNCVKAALRRRTAVTPIPAAASVIKRQSSFAASIPGRGADHHRVLGQPSRHNIIHSISLCVLSWSSSPLNIIATCGANALRPGPASASTRTPSRWARRAGPKPTRCYADNSMPASIGSPSDARSLRPSGRTIDFAIFFNAQRIPDAKVSIDGASIRFSATQSRSGACSLVLVCAQSDHHGRRAPARAAAAAIETSRFEASHARRHFARKRFGAVYW